MASRPGNKALKRLNRRNNHEVARRFRELEICTSKTRFTTEEEAEAALIWILLEGEDAPYKPVRVYACGPCAGWHLTSLQQSRGSERWTDRS
jgi:hypothetical protein